MGELLFHLQNMCRKAEPCQHHAEDIFVSDIYHNVEHRIMTEVRLWNTRMNPIISPNKLNSLISALNRRFITRWVSDEKIFDSQELFSHFFARFLSVYTTMGSLLEVSDMKYVNNISFVHRALSNNFAFSAPHISFFIAFPPPPLRSCVLVFPLLLLMWLWESTLPNFWSPLDIMNIHLLSVAEAQIWRDRWTGGNASEWQVFQLAGSSKVCFIPSFCIWNFAISLHMSLSTCCRIFV